MLVPSLPVGAPTATAYPAHIRTLPCIKSACASSCRVPDHLPQATFLEVPDNRISRLHCAIRLQASGCLHMLLCISLPALRHAPAGKWCLQYRLGYQRQPSPSNRRWLALGEPDSNRSQGSAFCTVLLHRKHCGPPNFANTVLLSCPVHNEATGIMPKENASGKCFALLWLQTI